MLKKMLTEVIKIFLVINFSPFLNFKKTYLDYPYLIKTIASFA